MRIVLDTNVLVSGIFWEGPPSKIITSWIRGNIKVFVTKKILKEYFEVLDRFDTSREIAKKWEMLILENVAVVEEKKRIKLSRDPHDDKFINCALAAKATYIISGDRDLLTLKEKSPIKIITPSEFCKIWKKCD